MQLSLYEIEISFHSWIRSVLVYTGNRDLCGKTQLYRKELSGIFILINFLC